MPIWWRGSRACREPARRWQATRSPSLPAARAPTRHSRPGARAPKCCSPARPATTRSEAPALAGLAAAGVDVARVRTAAAPTGVALIHVDAEGRNAITVIAGANALADPDAVEEAALGEHSTLVLQFELPVAAVTALARRARQRGARVLLNAAPAIPLPAALAATLDVLVVNEHEAQVLARETGLPDAPAAFAAAWHRRHGAAVVVTLGAAGVVAAADGRMHALAAPRVEVVDTTGAGDAFVGTLAAALDRGRAWPRSAGRRDRRRRARVHGLRRAGRAAGGRPHRRAGGAARGGDFAAAGHVNRGSGGGT